MTMLQPALLTWYQFGEATPDHNESCGQNATASCLVGGGHLAANSQAPLSVDQWMRNQGWQGLATGGTDTWQIVAALAHFGPGGATDHGDNFDAIIPTLQAGRYVIVLVGSDHLGHPVPAAQAVTGHWVAVYGWDGANYHIANSGSGKTETYDADYFRSAYRAITLDSGITPAGATGDEPMTDDDKKWVGRLVIEAVLALGKHEGPATPGIAPQIESFLPQVVADPEGGMSNLISKLQTDGGYIWNADAYYQGIIKQLQTDVAALKAGVK